MRVAIYSRKSIETDKGDSIKNQIQMCKEYFSRREENVVFEIFEDEGFSGANTNRPSFQLMMKQLNSFDVIAVYRLDRISRNVLDFLNTFEDLKKYNVKFISITENFDTESPMGKMMLLMLSGFAQMERENIAQRVKDNMRELAKSGKWTGGTVPFGYTTERVEEGTKKSTYLKNDDSKNELIKNIFGYYIETQSMHQVQKWLYTNGFKWCLSTVKNILTSPVYVKVNNAIVEYLKNFGEVFGNSDSIHGIITYNRRPYTNGKHRWNDKSMFYSISKHNGIIDPSVWLKVQTIQNKSRIAPRPKESQVSYLTGVLKCAKCGSPMTVSYNHKKKDGSISYVYLCTGRKSFGSDFCNTSQVKQSIYDNKFLQQLSSFSNLTFEEFKNLVGKNDAPNNQVEVKSLEKKIKSNKLKIDNLIDKLSELSNAVGVSLMKKVNVISDENEELKINLLHIKQAELSNSNVTLEFVYEQLKNFVFIFDNLDMHQKREFIKSFLSEVRYNSDTMVSEIDFL